MGRCATANQSNRISQSEQWVGRLSNRTHLIRLSLCMARVHQYHMAFRCRPPMVPRIDEGIHQVANEARTLLANTKLKVIAIQSMRHAPIGALTVKHVRYMENMACVIDNHTVTTTVKLRLTTAAVVKALVGADDSHHWTLAPADTREPMAWHAYITPGAHYVMMFRLPHYGDDVPCPLCDSGVMPPCEDGTCAIAWCRRYCCCLSAFNGDIFWPTWLMNKQTVLLPPWTPTPPHTATRISPVYCHGRGK